MTIDEAINVLRWLNPPRANKKSFDDFVQAIDIAIKALKKQRWIPVSERLPEDDTEVLVYLFENNKSPYIAWLSDGRWYTEYFEVEQEDEPVAWMSLPEPYQEGEQE